MSEQKLRKYRFHENEPKGQIFNCTAKEFDKLADDGWVDSPAKLKNQPKKEQVITADQAKSLDPQALVAMVESLGYKVFTPEMLEAEINKALSVPIDVSTVSLDLLKSEYVRRIGGDGFVAINLESVNSESLLSECVRRELIPIPDPVETIAPMGAKTEEGAEATIDELFEQFNEEPEALIIDELVTLGNVKFKLGLRSNMKEATLIEKIKAAMAVNV